MSIENINHELSMMDCTPKALDLMREKDGIALYAVKTPDGARYVLKYFENEVYRREILHYKQLQSIGVPTIPLIATTEKAMLMEDLRFSECWRLGTAEDMKSEAVAHVLAAWYLQLHKNGKTLANQPELNWYSELHLFNREGFDLVKAKTQSHDAKLWHIAEENFELITGLIQKTAKTLSYNDFYYVNLAVTHDESQALMFDYNFLGIGYPSMDLRNVCASLSPEAGKAFMQAYGQFDEQEILLDEVVSPIITLVIGAQREERPGWFDEAWQEVHRESFLEKLKELTKP